MLSIFVCDDDPIFLEAFLPKVRSAFDGSGCMCTVQGYTGSQSFLAAVRKSQEPCLIFMDLALGQSDGYALCEELRSAGCMFETVFITNYPERMPEAFAHRPIGFIVKSSDRFLDELKAIPIRYTRYHAPAELYTIETRGEHIRVPLPEIEYFENNIHTVTIHTLSQQYRQRIKLDDIESAVGSRFIRVHQSYLVNIDMIHGIDRNKHRLQLCSGHDIPISKSRYAEVMRRFIAEHLN